MEPQSRMGDLTCGSCAKKALKCWISLDLQKEYLSVRELQILIYMAKILFKEGNQRYAIEILLQIEAFIPNRYQEGKEILKVYPECLYYLSRFFLDEKNYGRAFELTEKGLHLLIKNKRLQYVTDFLFLKAYLHEALFFEERDERKNIYLQLYFLLHLYGEKKDELEFVQKKLEDSV